MKQSLLVRDKKKQKTGKAPQLFNLRIKHMTVKNIVLKLSINKINL